MLNWCDCGLQVCHHPYLLEEFRPEQEDPGAAAEDGAGALSSPTPRQGAQRGSPGLAPGGMTLDALLAGSGKLRVLDEMLQELNRRGSCVLVLSQSSKVR